MKINSFLTYFKLTTVIKYESNFSIIVYTILLCH